LRLLWLWIIATIVIWPIHSTVATVGDKPIDLLCSDLFLLMMPLTYLFARSKPSAAQKNSARVPIGLGMSGETVRIFSAFKLAKPIGFVLLGLVLGSWTNPIEFIDIVSWAYAVVVGLTLFFTVTDPGFPLGEWGKYIFEFELSGYPNSPMSFYAVLVPLLLAVADSAKIHFLQWTARGLAAGSALMILGSMSRSSALALIVATTIYLILTGRAALLIVSTIAIIIVSTVGFGLFSVLRDTQVVTVLVDRVQERIDRSTEQQDPSSGRFDIWQLALELWTERPVFGYMFESFSRYADVDTPHQQYLEVLHKCGGVGLAFYLALLVSCLTATRRLLRLASRGTPAWYQLHAMTGMLVGVMVGNLTQPNLTYSLTGNMVFLLFGCLCSARAVVSVSQSVATSTPRYANGSNPPSCRIAA
jgi:O-antigen ligase